DRVRVTDVHREQQVSSPPRSTILAGRSGTRHVDHAVGSSRLSIRRTSPKRAATSARAGREISWTASNVSASTTAAYSRGADGGRQLAHHRRGPAEVAGPAHPLEPLSERAGVDADLGGSRRIHLLGRGSEEDVDPDRLSDAPVVILISRIRGQVIDGSELDWV